MNIAMYSLSIAEYIFYCASSLCILYVFQDRLGYTYPLLYSIHIQVAVQELYILFYIPSSYRLSTEYSKNILLPTIFHSDGRIYIQKTYL